MNKHFFHLFSLNSLSLFIYYAIFDIANFCICVDVRNEAFQSSVLLLKSPNFLRYKNIKIENICLNFSQEHFTFHIHKNELELFSLLIALIQRNNKMSISSRESNSYSPDQTSRISPKVPGRLELCLLGIYMTRVEAQNLAIFLF